MNNMAAPSAFRSAAACFKHAAALCALLVVGGCAATPESPFLTTKTPYRPARTASGDASAPPGFTPLHTQLVARHGARAMTGMKDDLALLNMCRQAAREQALTPLGQQLLADVERLVQVQLLLGHGVDGIARPGYANLSAIGIDEHRQLALRVLQRQPALFADADAGPRTIVVQHSGVDRARESGVFFIQSLTAAAPRLAPLVEPPAADRFTLYFHKLNAATDAAIDGTIAAGDPRHATFAASQRYQAFLRSAALKARLDAVAADPRLDEAARIVLARLFRPAFLDRLADRELRFTNSGRMEATSGDGKLHVVRDGDGKTVIASPRDALMALSAVYEIAPGLRVELGRDFRAYIPDAQAQLLAWANDAEDFYEKGPGMAAEAPVTYQMAEGLLRDFFDEAQHGSARHLATFRFSHAEIIIPLATLLGLPGSDVPLAPGQAYSYADNPWRGRDVAPYAANIQWDSYRDAQGRVLVRMLYNERQTPFKAACDQARYRPDSAFYDLKALRACYLGD